MLSRTWITCVSCKIPITARIQVGHEIEQPINFPCPNCGTEVRLSLILDEPPRVKIQWNENCEEGNKEGTIINISSGFTIDKNKLHQDSYFPSWDAPRPTLQELQNIRNQRLRDAAIATGTLPYAAKHWHTLKSALRFHRTGQSANMEQKLEEYWEMSNFTDKSIENALFIFLMRFMEPSANVWINPLAMTLKKAESLNRTEYIKLVSHYDKDLKKDRFEAYAEIISDYFKAYGEFNQTLIYVRRQITLPKNTVATSSDFDKTKMFYGSAFEVLGSHLDLVAAVNNILCGRAFDKMEKMDLKQFRTINKANRTNCFSKNAELSWLVNEYDSTIRNASHHRWFKLDDSRSQITYRSGGTGAIHKISYADYLTRCNRIVMQLMTLACLELLLMTFADIKF